MYSFSSKVLPVFVFKEIWTIYEGCNSAKQNLSFVLLKSSPKAKNQLPRRADSFLLEQLSCWKGFIIQRIRQEVTKFFFLVKMVQKEKKKDVHLVTL